MKRKQSIKTLNLFLNYIMLIWPKNGPNELIMRRVNNECSVGEVRQECFGHAIITAFYHAIYDQSISYSLWLSVAACAVVGTMPTGLDFCSLAFSLKPPLAPLVAKVAVCVRQFVSVATSYPKCPRCPRSTTKCPMCLHVVSLVSASPNFVIVVVICN